MYGNQKNFDCFRQHRKGKSKMIYRRIETASDTDIPYLTEILNLPEISHFISINENNYWNYVTETENVFYFKVFNNDILVAATHCEISNKTLYMDIMVIPKYQRNGIATRILQDIKSGKLDIDYKKIEVSIDENNIASISLFEKEGFVCVSKEAELRNYVYLKHSG